MYKITIARPTGYKLECPEIGTFLMDFTARVRDFPDVGLIDTFNVQNPRIAMCRNACVAHARDVGSTHILWLDPDMVIDRYVQRTADGRSVPGRAKPFFPVAWDFIKRHAQAYGPCVVAAPYASCYPHRAIHVFAASTTGNSLARITHAEAAKLSGWTQVRAVGTGCMLMDVKVFDRLQEPYFDDLFKTVAHADLHHSQDVRFCLKCAGAKVPIYVNWDCPAGHYQNTIVEMPGWDSGKPPESIIPTAADPSVPLLVIQGEGDTSWNK
jgi:hypothetical protein